MVMDSTVPSGSFVDKPKMTYHKPSKIWVCYTQKKKSLKQKYSVLILLEKEQRSKPAV